MAKNNDRNFQYWSNIKKEAQAIRKNLVSLKNVYAKTNLETSSVGSAAQPTQESSPTSTEPVPKVQPTQVEVHSMQNIVQPTQTKPQPAHAEPQPVQIKVQPMLTNVQPTQSKAPTPTKVQVNLKSAKSQAKMSMKVKPVFDMFVEDKKFYEDVEITESFDSKDPMFKSFEETPAFSGKRQPNQVSKWKTVSSGSASQAQQKPCSPAKSTENPDKQIVQGPASNVYLIVQDKVKPLQNIAEVARKTNNEAGQGSVGSWTPDVVGAKSIKKETREKNNTEVLKEDIKPISRAKPQWSFPASLRQRIFPSGIPRSFIMQNPKEYLQANYPEQAQYIMQAAFSDVTSQLTVQTEVDNAPQQYSPSDAYEDTSFVGDQGNKDEYTESTEAYASGQKRLSAFQRLGPMTEPKKPKLTINLTCSKDQSVREVVDLTDKESDKYEPVHLRDDVRSSTNEIVKTFLPMWPWQKQVTLRKTASARVLKSVMLLELEQMEDIYERDHVLICVSVKGYPAHWNKEDVLDAILDHLKGKSFVPLYIDFQMKECRFFVVKSRPALVAIHKFGFYVKKDGVELKLTLAQSDLNVNSLSLQPKVVLKRLLSQQYDGERKLALKEFTLGSDISNFIYYPLNCLTNQMDLLELQSDVVWEYITDLDLSGNRLTALDGFNLPKMTPRLKNLDLSNNYLDKLTLLLNCKALTLRSIRLEGNPLCTDYTDPSYYVEVLRMIFPTLKEIDGMLIQFSGDIPKARRNYCMPEAKEVVEKFLDVYFPLLETEDRKSMVNMYSENAVLSITFRNSLRSSGTYIYFRNLFNKARFIKEGDVDCIEGAGAIARHVSKWPPLVHDPYSFTVDVMHHDDAFTVIRVGGLMKLTSESLADDEHMLAFTRTLLLHTSNGVEYKIQNEMIYWDEPSWEWGSKAFQINTVKRRRVSLQLDSVPDGELQNSLIEIFMKITELDEKASHKCLEVKDWNFKEALQHFVKLLKLDGLECLRT